MILRHRLTGLHGDDIKLSPFFDIINRSATVIVDISNDSRW
jgi:hypothetical protein